MKTIVYSMAAVLGIFGSAASAEQIISVDGVDYTLSGLMANCQEMTDDPAGQIACFNNVSQLILEQSNAVQDVVSIPDALSALRTAAQYQDAETGLGIIGDACSIQVVYFGNYFHVSRRNISNVDLVSVSFDAAKLELDRSVGVPGAQAPLSTGVMQAGSTATVIGGLGLDSSRDGFAPKSARVSIAEFSTELLGQVPARDEQRFDFVLVHPKRSAAGPEIWDAFETFVKACQQ